MGEAAAINATLSASRRELAFEALAHDELEFIVLAPKQFNNPETLDRLRAAKPCLAMMYRSQR